MSKYSIVIPCFNNFSFTRNCVESICRNVSDFELVLIDNGSTDQTSVYFDSLVLLYPNTKIITYPDNVGFSIAVNAGIKASTGLYIVVLNNDTLIGPACFDHLVESLLFARSSLNDSKIMFCGPVSNNASGLQSVELSDPSVPDIDSFVSDFYNNNQKPFFFSNFLSGFCFLFDREFLDSSILFDESFLIGGFEDNDFFHRVTLSGFKCIINPSVFIYHFGQSTLKNISNYQSTYFNKNCLYYIQKFSSSLPSKLVIILRVKNGSLFIRNFLESASRFTKYFIILLNDCTDDTESICRSFPFLNINFIFRSGFNESRDRQVLLHQAFVDGFDWALSLDVDEELPYSVTADDFQRLMHPVNPDIVAYSFPVYTFFESKSFIRMDFPWSELRGVRLFKLFPNQRIDSYGDKGLHCSHSPTSSPFTARDVNFPILHHGYNTRDLRLSKKDFYDKIDRNPYQQNRGPYGYKHLTTSNIQLAEYKSNNSICLAILCKDNFSELLALLFNHYFFFNEICVLHTGSSPEIKSLCSSFGANYFKHSFKNDFSELRNYLKSKIKSSWIFFLDTDEYLQLHEFSALSLMSLRDVDGFLFLVHNFQPNGDVLISDNVRMIRNIPAVYWTHPIHESVSESVKLNHLEIVPAYIPIKHVGFLKDKYSRDSKSSLYLSILHKDLKKHPQDASIYFHLSFHYLENNDFLSGIKYLQKCISLDPNFFLAHKELALRFIYSGIDYLHQCLDILPREHYFYPFLSRLFDYVSKCLDFKI